MNLQSWIQYIQPSYHLDTNVSLAKIVTSVRQEGSDWLKAQRDFLCEQPSYKSEHTLSPYFASLTRIVYSEVDTLWNDDPDS